MSSDSTPVAGATGTAVDPPLFADPGETFDAARELLGRKWHLPVVYHLLTHGPTGFSALKRDLDGISSKMLSESLTHLERDGLVDREVVSERPVRVEYSLTESGHALEPVVSSLLAWETEHGPDREAR